MPVAVELTREYQRSVAVARDKALALATSEWSNVTLADIDGSFAPVKAQIAEMTYVAERAALEATQRYLARFGVDTPVAAGFIRSESQIADRLERGAIVMKIAVAQRRTDGEALSLGLNRVLQIIRDEVTEVPHLALDDVLKRDPDVIGWTRVTAGTCAFCKSKADGSVQKTGTAMSRHPNCQCVSEPVVRNAPLSTRISQLEERMRRHFDRYSTNGVLKGGKKYKEMEDELKRLKELEASPGAVKPVPEVPKPPSQPVQTAPTSQVPRVLADVEDDLPSLRAAIADLNPPMQGVIPAKNVSLTSERRRLAKSMIKDRGFDGKPQLVSRAEFDAVDSPELYRGLQGFDGRSAAQLADEFRTGDYYVGSGMRGPGTYTSPMKEVADGYASDGGLMKMKLAPDAKTIGAREASDAYYKELSDLFSYRMNRALEIDRDAALSDAEKQMLLKRLDRECAVKDELLQDEGTWAIARGYDAIIDPEYPQTVVLNRSKVLMVK